MGFFKPDSWKFARDKRGHLSAGIAIAAATMMFGFSSGMAMLAVLAIALLKEFYDSKHLDVHTPSIIDAAYTTVGGVLGALLAMKTTPSFAASIGVVLFIVTQAIMKE